jgi:hypothetical protein
MDFVVGHPRSGTMLFSRLCNAAQPQSAGHELLYPLSSDMVWATSEYYHGRLDAEAVRRLLAHYRDSPARIDCNWKLTWILPVLVEVFPEARIIHLARNPVDNIRSAYNLDYYGATTARDDHRRDYFLRFMPRIHRDDWDALTQLEKNCAFFVESHRLIRAAAPHARLVRVEELAHPEVAAAALAHLGLPALDETTLAALLSSRVNAKDDEKAEVADLRGRPPVAEWDSESLATIARLCGEVARELGYHGLA